MNCIKRCATLAFALVMLTPWCTLGAQEESVNVDIDVERIIEETQEGDGKRIVIVRKEERTQDQEAPEPLGMNVTLEFTLEGSGRSFSMTTATTSFMLSSQQSSKASERIIHEDLDGGEYEEEYEEEELFDEGEFEEEDEYDVDFEGEEFEEEEYEQEEEYELATAESYSTTEYQVNLDGSLQHLEDGTLLVRCAGAFMHVSQANEQHEEAAEEVDTSSILNFETSAIMRPGETRVLVTQGDLRLVLHLSTDES